MKRVAFGILWFVVFLLVALVAVSIVVGDAAPDAQAAHAAGVAFGKTYGRPLIVGCLFAAALGAYFRVLPGTRQTGR